MGTNSQPPGPLLPAILILLLVSSFACGCMFSGETMRNAPGVDSSTPTLEKIPASVTPVSPLVIVEVTMSPPPNGTTAAGPTPGSPVIRSFTFLSGKKTYHLSVTVDPSTAGSANATSEHCPMARWRPGNEGQVSAYYLDQMFSAEDEDVYTALTSELSRIRRMEGLNDDEYLELVTNFIQQIPYDPHAPLCPRSPPSVIRDGKGDCDEKSSLLLGLLSREGYDVALLLFPNEHHATAGIRITSTTTPSFRVFGPRSGTYVYVETTRPSLIGLYGDDFATATPVVVPVGNGTIRYRAINDVMYVIGVQKRMEDRMTFLWETREETLQEISLLEGRLGGGYYDTAEEYNDAYARYSRLIADYNQMGEDFTAIQGVYQFLREHQYDRAGCRGRIENSKVELLL